MRRRWHFFRAGGVDQVSLRDGSDLLNVCELDPKLWLALAMPVDGVDLDPATLAMLDLDGDGRIRIEEVHAAIAFLASALHTPAEILTASSTLELTAIKDPVILAAARRILSDLGRAGTATIHVDDTIAIAEAHRSTLLNGDGIVLPASTSNADLRMLIEDTLATIGSVQDRSGKPGVDRARFDSLFAAVDARRAWLRRGEAFASGPLGAGIEAAAAAFQAVRAKLDDYFTRCQLAAFDERSVPLLAGRDDELGAIAARELSRDDAALAKLPVAKPHPSGRLTLSKNLNPAWAPRIEAFVQLAVVPLLGTRDTLERADLARLAATFDAYLEWQASKPATPVDTLDLERIVRYADPELRRLAGALIDDDAALAPEYDAIASVGKLVRLKRDGGRLLRNFVSFSDFYSRQDGVFQAGTLYLDARAYHLCIAVTDPAKHAALAASSGAYLLYCEIKRRGVTKQIAVAVTNGDSDHLFVGRNGVFYDRQDNDWDATIVKIIANPISVREAFWAPYKKVVRTIEDAITKRAAAADAESATRLDAVGKQVAVMDKTAAASVPASAPAPAAAAAPAPKKLDLGSVAAIGLAIGGIGTFVGMVFGAMFGLGKWLPLGIVALLLVISGPSMLLAWMKLRRRNLGPILDANGWAINGRARINVPFGARMTELAALPPDSERSLDDPFAEKRTPWKRWVALVVLVVLGTAWCTGQLDRWLPERIRAVEVLGTK